MDPSRPVKQLFSSESLNWTGVIQTHRSYLSNEIVSFFMQKQTNRKLGSFKRRKLKKKQPSRTVGAVLRSFESLYDHTRKGSANSSAEEWKK